MLATHARGSGLSTHPDVMPLPAVAKRMDTVEEHKRFDSRPARMNDRHIEELVTLNPCTGYYRMGWLMNAWMEDRGWDEEQRKVCIHCKTTPGCPGCDDRVLRYWGINSLLRWNPEVYSGLVLDG